MKITRVDPDRCKTCWNCEPGFRCIVPYEPRYELFRSYQKIKGGPAGKMRVPPCVAACPANICVQGYVGLVAAGLYEQAYRLIRWRVPFPHTLSLVCPHPCEDACIRGDYDRPIAINALKRFAVEQTTPEMRQRFLDELKSEIVENGRKIAVIGAGPAGLTAAHDLRLRGYAVTVFEALPRAGGMMLTGIPEYRLPRPVLEEEIAEILELGIELVTGIRVGEDVPLEELLREYEAIFLASGAHHGVKLNIPGEEAAGVLDGLRLLRAVNLGGERPRVGTPAVVIGGGDAAIDGARVALRLGAKRVSILYRRSRAEMPAHPEQVEGALAEGIRIEEQVAPRRFLAQDGRLEGLELIRTELGPPDESGRRRPIPIEGSEFVIEADTAIVAIGQRAEPGLLQDLGVELNEGGWVRIDEETGQTSIESLFAGGDVASGPATVIAAIAAGKRAAWGIDRYLRGDKAKEVCFRTWGDSEQEERYRPPHVPQEERAVISQVPAEERIEDFRLIELGLAEEAARAEAWRCLACGLCANCNACLDTFACPAIFLGEQGKIAIEETLCDNCGLCLQLCPNDAIAEVEVPEEERVGA